MYEVLRKDLERDRKDGHGFWWLIKDIFEIHLGVADKCGLLMHLKQTDYSNLFDLRYDAANYLWNRGYYSKHLKSLINEYDKSEKFALGCWRGSKRSKKVG